MPPGVAGSLPSARPGAPEVFAGVAGGLTEPPNPGVAGGRMLPPTPPGVAGGFKGPTGVAGGLKGPAGVAGAFTGAGVDGGLSGPPMTGVAGGFNGPPGVAGGLMGPPTVGVAGGRTDVTTGVAGGRIGPPTVGVAGGLIDPTTGVAGGLMGPAGVAGGRIAPGCHRGNGVAGGLMLPAAAGVAGGRIPPGAGVAGPGTGRPSAGVAGGRMVGVAGGATFLAGAAATAGASRPAMVCCTRERTRSATPPAGPSLSMAVLATTRRRASLLAPVAVGTQSSKKRRTLCCSDSRIICCLSWVLVQMFFGSALRKRVSRRSVCRSTCGSSRSPVSVPTRAHWIMKFRYSRALTRSAWVPEMMTKVPQHSMEQAAAFRTRTTYRSTRWACAAMEVTHKRSFAGPSEGSSCIAPLPKGGVR
mmetsp:Transcript_52387/g.111624  ORF Transcript_52387/g.111624 Transcript_52387/m.111624 type:complete len:415 (+) Transcript_52387:287-1531(+)